MDSSVDKPTVIMILHAYQPPYPIQEKWVIRRIIENSYLPLTKELEEYPSVKLIVNMNASLTEILQNEDPRVLEYLTQGAERGQIEFLESGAYHPIFPFLSKDEKIEQLRLNHEINKQAFGNVYHPIGVWPPELAVDLDTLAVFHELGYQYSVVPSNSLPQGLEHTIPYIEFNNTNRFALISRDRLLSNNIAFKSFGNRLEDIINTVITRVRDKPLVLAMDFETFGEHHPNYYKFLFEFLGHNAIRAGTSHELLQTPSWTEIKTFHASSWSTEDHERKHGIPFPLWDHPANSIHAIQHAHFLLLKESINQKGGINSLPTETKLIVLKAMHSCQWWWASGNGRWSPSMIKKGFELQRQALKQIVSKNHVFTQLSNALLKRLEFAIET